MVGRADDDGVDVFARQHLAIVARGEELVAPDFAGAFQAAVVDIGDGDEFYAADIERIAGIAAALPSGADQGDADAVVGRGILGREQAGAGRGGEEVTSGSRH